MKKQSRELSVKLNYWPKAIHTHGLYKIQNNKRAISTGKVTVALLLNLTTACRNYKIQYQDDHVDFFESPRGIFSSNNIFDSQKRPLDIQLAQELESKTSISDKELSKRFAGIHKNSQNESCTSKLKWGAKKPKTCRKANE